MVVFEMNAPSRAIHRNFAHIVNVVALATRVTWNRQVELVVRPHREPLAGAGDMPLPAEWVQRSSPWLSAVAWSVSVITEKPSASPLQTRSDSIWLSGTRL